MKGNRLWVIADELHVKPASTGSSTSIIPGSSDELGAYTKLVASPTQQHGSIAA